MTDITANVVVSMPSQLFTMARSFKAVANGKIYIGKIDTDPVNPENQIQVYVENEDGSHVPVSQPIIINAAGYPVYNGQIAKFVTVQGHSMAVYDAYGTQQFYFPNVLKYDPDQLRQQLASSEPGNGGSLVMLESGETVQEAVNRIDQDITDEIQEAVVKMEGEIKESGRLINPVFNLIEAINKITDLSGWRKTGTSPGNVMQSFVIDRVNNKIYFLHEAISNSQGVVTRGDYNDHSYTYVTNSAQNGSTLIGHQGISLQYLPDGSTKLLATYRPDNRFALRFDYTDSGDPSNTELTRLFPDDAVSSNCMPEISSDGRFLVAHAKKDNVTQWVRGWYVDDIVWGTTSLPGDTSGVTPAFEFTFDQTDFIDDVAYFYQAHACDGNSLVVLSGSLYIDNKPRMKQFDLYGNDIFGSVTINNDLWALHDAAGTTPVMFEPEGIQFKGRDLVIGYGTGVTGQRTVRLFKLGDFSLEDKVDACMKAFMSRLGTDSMGTFAQRSNLREFYRAIIADGIWPYLSLFYFLAAPNKNWAYINIANPDMGYLSETGSATWEVITSGVRWKGNGTNAYLSSEVTWYTAPNYHRNNCWLGCHLPSGDGDSGAITGSLNNGYCHFNPRNTSNIAIIRANNGKTGEQTVASSDALGWTSAVRTGQSTVEFRRNGVVDSTVNVVAGDLGSGNVIIGASPETFSGRSINAVVVGGAIPSALEARFAQHVSDYLSTLI